MVHKVVILFQLLLMGQNLKAVYKLQLIQNVAVCVVNGFSRKSHAFLNRFTYYQLLLELTLSISHCFCCGKQVSIHNTSASLPDSLNTRVHLCYNQHSEGKILFLTHMQKTHFPILSFITVFKRFESFQDKSRTSGTLRYKFQCLSQGCTIIPQL